MFESTIVLMVGVARAPQDRIQGFAPDGGVLVVALGLSALGPGR